MGQIFGSDVRESYNFGAGDTGGSGQCPTGRTFCVGLTLKLLTNAA
jgi:hypothetical protein